MTALRIVLETESNFERTERHRIGDKLALLSPEGAPVVDVGRIKGLEILDDQRLAITVELERPVSVTGERGI